MAAGIILPLLDKAQHHANWVHVTGQRWVMERVENCICVVVSEETGSLSLAERGTLHRPLTSSKLKELLDA